jgi:hypothetical protein
MAFTSQEIEMAQGLLTTRRPQLQPYQVTLLESILRREPLTPLVEQKAKEWIKATLTAPGATGKEVVEKRVQEVMAQRVGVVPVAPEEGASVWDKFAFAVADYKKKRAQADNLNSQLLAFPAAIKKQPASSQPALQRKFNALREQWAAIDAQLAQALGKIIFVRTAMLSASGGIVDIFPEVGLAGLPLIVYPIFGAVAALTVVELMSILKGTEGPLSATTRGISELSSGLGVVLKGVGTYLPWVVIGTLAVVGLLAFREVKPFIGAAKKG